MPIRKRAQDSASSESRPPLHPLESTLVGVTVLHLCFLPWALGTMHVWSRFTSLGLAAIGFFLALLPRRNPLDRGSATAIDPLAPLLRWPGFWCGIALLAYVSIQGINASWIRVQSTDSWWLERIPHVTWLPAGIRAPFGNSNAWQAIVVYASLWLTVCSLWSGFTRRQGLRVLFLALAANAGLLALLGVLQKLTGAKGIFWTYDPSNSAFTASFIYPNHAGAYLNLMIALSAGLALWFHGRARLKMESPSVAWILGIVALVAALTVVLTSSRASIALLVVFVALATAVFGCRWFWRRIVAGNPRAKIAPLLTALAALAAIVVTVVNSERAWRRFDDLFSNPGLAMKDRSVARQAAWDMFSDRWFLGWGAGCFRHGFPLYAQHHPEIHPTDRNRRMFWEHAHSDLIQFPLELGVAGILPFLVAVAHGLRSIVRQRMWRNPVSLSLLAGCGLLLLHAYVDFVLQCPAVLLTAAVFFIGAQRWAALDAAGSSPAR